MDIANGCGGMVIGTGDLSELALGWATYNGDHMSMYAVNGSVPKTMIRYLVGYIADTNPALTHVLRSILDTPVSPELLPAVNGEISQKTEDLVGPYELHDFFLYYGIRWGFEPKKVYRIAKYAFEGDYDGETILKWLKTFYRRFFSQQFQALLHARRPQDRHIDLVAQKRLENASDAASGLWLRELEEI
jgi:NAD+ synthase (glutamine-hydrolysing)